MADQWIDDLGEDRVTPRPAPHKRPPSITPSSVKPFYGYAFPKYQRGDKVVFIDHNYRGILEGEVVSVETHYDHQNLGTHVYSILPLGHKRQKHIAERFVTSSYSPLVWRST